MTMMMMTMHGSLFCNFSQLSNDDDDDGDDGDDDDDNGGDDDDAVSGQLRQKSQV